MKVDETSARRRPSSIESLMQLVSSLICLTGFGTEAAAEGYEVFKEAMAEIGVLLCRHIHHPTNRDLAFPEAVFWMEACGTHLQGLDATLRFWACPFGAVWPRLRRSWRSKTFVGDLGDRHWQRGGWACEMALFTRHLMQGHRQCRSSIHTDIINYEPYREHQSPYIELLPSTKDNHVPSCTQIWCTLTICYTDAVPADFCMIACFQLKAQQVLSSLRLENPWRSSGRSLGTAPMTWWFPSKVSRLWLNHNIS